MTSVKNLFKKKWLIVLGAGFMLALLNTNHTIHSAILNIDRQVAIAMNSMLGINPIFDETLARLSTRLGDVFVLICLSLLFFIHALRGESHNETIKRLSYWLWLAVLCLITYLISCATECFVQRNTPIAALPHFYNLQTTFGVTLHSCPTSSFPSGHALAYIFFAMMAWRRYFKVSLILWCLAFIMLSIRLIVGLHWFSDILVGSLFISTLLVTLIDDTPLKNTYKLAEQAVRHVFGMLSDWRERCCETIIKKGNHKRIY